MESNPRQTSLDSRMRALLDRRHARSTLRHLTLPVSGRIDFSSNDFLSLSASPLLKADYLAELGRNGLPLGSGGSRLLDGNSGYAEDLERSVAAFHRAESGLLFNSGFDANAGLFACLPQPGDVVVFDELVHASVHDGIKMSRAASALPFAHNSVSSLRQVLQRLEKDAQAQGAAERCIIVAVEAIYSMDGDVAPLLEIVNVVEQVLGTAKGYVVVDEAHSTGVLGPRGRGLVCELNLETRVFARLHTFGKSLAANGAIVLGSPTLRHYLVNYARPLIYTTCLSYPSIALIKTSYQLLQSGNTVHLQRQLLHLTQVLFKALDRLQRTSVAARTVLEIPSACPGSPIFAIRTEYPRKLAKYLQDQDMMVRAVVPPTVPVGTQRVRVCLHAGNTTSELEKLVVALEQWCNKRLEDEAAEKRTKPLVHARL